MRYEIKNRVNIIIIIASGILIHCTMLFVNGAWWDDWKFYVCDYAEMKAHYISAGRLDAYYIIGLIYNLPVSLFRFAVILCYTLSAVFIYAILLHLFRDYKQALGIAVLYNAVPVNDVRIMKCVFPYTFALFLFWLAALLSVYMFEANGKRYKSGIRVLSLLLFFISFSTNSLLFFYVIPILMIWFIEIRELKYDNNINIFNCIKRFLWYADYYIVPILFYVIKKICFSPDSSGAYKNYNAMTISRVLSAVKIMHKAILETGYSILENWIYVIKSRTFMIVIYLLVFLFFFIVKKYVADTKERIPIWNALIGFFVGAVIFSIGLFPYNVIRTGVIAIGVSGIAGRDAILTSFGIAIMFYHGINLLRIPNWAQCAIISCMLLISFIHFTGWYVSYLGGEYEQAALQQAWLETDYVKEGKTFIYIRRDKGAIDGERFYSLNALSKQAYGDSSRFFAAETQDLEYITDYENKEMLSSDVTYAMDQYDLNDIDLNGIMIVSYHLSKWDCIQLKYKEIFKKKEFSEDVRNCLDYEYIVISRDISNQIYDMYQSEMLTSDEELLNFLADLGCFNNNQNL